MKATLAVVMLGLGACVSSPPTPCTNCNGVCVDTNTDSANCGGCGTQCGAGKICRGGTCGLTCPAGTMTCSDGCADVANDPAHCGNCMTVCGAEEGCAAAVCTRLCVAPQQVCNALCVDTTHDRANCGACGNICGPGQICSAGQCGESCAVGLSVCGTAATAYCANLQDDGTNCGVCGKSCGALERCFSGACQQPVPTPRFCSDLDGGPRPTLTTLFLDGKPNRSFEALCSVDGGTYLPLARTDSASNFGNYALGGVFSGTPVFTRFTALRLLQIPVAVDGGVTLQPDGGGQSDAGLRYALLTDDFMFSTSTGLLQRPGNPDISQMPYASASDCVAPGSANGTGNVNLQGTPFSAAAGQFSTGGFMAAGSVNASAFGQVVNVTGGGYCGGTGIIGSRLLINWCPAPAAEVCDALDNDCDGRIDNLADGGTCP